MQIEGKREGACFRGLTVVSGAFVIVRSGGAAGKENPVIAVGAAAGDGEARRAGMGRKFAPFNLVWIFFIDLAEQAVVRGYVTRTTRRAGLGAIHDHDSAVRYAAGEPKHGRAGEGSGLSPGGFFHIVN